MFDCTVDDVDDIARSFVHVQYFDTVNGARIVGLAAGRWVERSLGQSEQSLAIIFPLSEYASRELDQVRVGLKESGSRYALSLSLHRVC